MATNPEKKLYSFKQYLMLLRNSKQRLEYNHGDIYLMAGSSANHAAISFNMCRALEDALGDDVPCRPYVVDRVVRLTPEVTVMPDVVVTCDTADHGEAFFLDSPRVVVEVLSKSTEPRDRTYKLLRYQEKQSVQEIVLISQYAQHVEVITRTGTSWQYCEYGYGEQFTLTSLDVTIRVADIYRRLSIPPVKRSSLPIEVVEAAEEPEDE
ncbi:MAG: Uma2 family endonuclease [Ktedonobacteraceae bacterium]